MPGPVSFTAISKPPSIIRALKAFAIQAERLLARVDKPKRYFPNSSPHRTLTMMTVREITPLGRISRSVLSAIDGGAQIEPISHQNPQLDVDAAYRVTAEIRRLRERRGERVVGRKSVSLTEAYGPYGVYAPIWGYVYDTTVHELPAPEPFDLTSFVEPRVEPEIVSGLSRAPTAEMDERALLSCIEWVAHGFEIVQSVFPGWRLRINPPLTAGEIISRSRSTNPSSPTTSYANAQGQVGEIQRGRMAGLVP
jgi:2-oxo-3-hexenedioate decarboxylase